MKNGTALGVISSLVLACAGCGGSDDEAATTADSPARVLVADKYKPTGEFCPTARICVREIEWSVYDADRAVGTGTGEACELEGGCNRYPELRLTFTKPQRVCGARRFTRLETFGTTFRLLEQAGCREYDV
jgi:hypothetical protein